MRKIVEKLKKKTCAHFSNEMKLMAEYKKANLSDEERSYLVDEMLKHPHAKAAIPILASQPNILRDIKR